VATEAEARRRPTATPLLLEREADSGALSSLLERARDGEGGLFVVEGAPGVGKTALLDHAAWMAREAGMRVLRARGRQLERSLAWGVARMLLEDHLAGPAAAHAERLLAGPAAPAAVVFDPRATAGDAVAAELGVAIAHALYRLVVRLADREPLVLVVDDAQWADASSLRFLVYLAGRLDEHPVAVVAGSRSGERGEEGLLDALVGAPAATVCTLAPLGADTVALLVRDRHPGADLAFCRRCHALTGGNPLELRELLAAVEARGATGREALEAAAADAAGSLARMVLRRLAAHSPDALQLARAVAVLEDEADPGLVAALARLAPAAMLAAVDELDAARVLRAGDTLAFDHPLVRAAVYGTLRYSERVAGHRRAAELLAARSAAPERVAAHLLECVPADDAAVVDMLRAAARRALEQGAPAAAARYLVRALREPPRQAMRATVLAELGRAEALAGLPQAPARLEAAIDGAQDRRQRAQLWLDLARALGHARQMEQSRQAFERGLAELDDDGSELALDLQAGHLTIAMHLPELAADVRRRTDDVLAGDAALTTRARRGLASKGMLVRLFAVGSHEEVLALARRIFADGRLVEEDRFDSLVLSHVISTLGWCDDYETADKALRMTFAEAERSGSSLAFAMASGLRSRQRLWTGTATDALEDARAAVDILRGSGLVHHLQPSVYCLVCALLHRRAADEAAAVMDLGGDAGPERSAWRHAARATLAAQRGDDEAALEAFLACGRRLDGILVSNPVVLPWRSEAGLAAQRLGRYAQAHALVAEELRLAETFGAPRAVAVARRAAGLLDRDAGTELLRSAAQALGDCGARLQHAQALLDLGATIRRSGRRREARETLHDALRLAEATDSTALAEQARTELRLAGGRAATPSSDFTDPLTASERRVAQLAATGQSNRQIADGLFLTVKSVEWHLGNVYRKLGIRGRAGLDAALRRDPAS
jgi:DNA-binding CsgD family transcriptional regulator